MASGRAGGQRRKEGGSHGGEPASAPPPLPVFRSCLQSAYPPSRPARPPACLVCPVFSWLRYPALPRHANNVFPVFDSLLLDVFIGGLRPLMIFYNKSY